MTDHGLTPAQYRERWNLPASYPMVAADYSARRKDLALKIGLGRKPAQANKAPAKGAAKAKPSTTKAKAAVPQKPRKQPAGDAPVAAPEVAPETALTPIEA